MFNDYGLIMDCCRGACLTFYKQGMLHCFIQAVVLLSQANIIMSAFLLSMDTASISLTLPETGSMKPYVRIRAL